MAIKKTLTSILLGLGLFSNAHQANAQDRVLGKDAKIVTSVQAFKDTPGKSISTYLWDDYPRCGSEIYKKILPPQKEPLYCGTVPRPEPKPKPKPWPIDQYLVSIYQPDIRKQKEKLYWLLQKPKIEIAEVKIDLSTDDRNLSDIIQFLQNAHKWVAKEFVKRLPKEIVDEITKKLNKFDQANDSITKKYKSSDFDLDTNERIMMYLKADKIPAREISMLEMLKKETEINMYGLDSLSK